MVTVREMLERVRRTPEYLHSSKETFEQRVATCNSCEHKGDFMGFEQCTACNCFVYLKAKLNNARCPAGKWEVNLIPVKELE